MSAPPPPMTGSDIGFLYTIIRDMDAKLDRLIETFATTRELAKVEKRVADLEGRWRANIGWIVGLIGALASLGDLSVILTK